MAIARIVHHVTGESGKFIRPNDFAEIEHSNADTQRIVSLGMGYRDEDVERNLFVIVQRDVVFVLSGIEVPGESTADRPFRDHEVLDKLKPNKAWEHRTTDPANGETGLIRVLHVGAVAIDRHAARHRFNRRYRYLDCQ